MDPLTFKGHIRVAYASNTNVAVPFTSQYLPGLRVLELKFASPLDRFAAVVVDIDEGAIGTDKQPLVPWSLTFNTGG